MPAVTSPAPPSPKPKASDHMSTPRIDPTFTMADLEAVGAKLLDAAQAYWEAAHKAGISGAIIWLEDFDGRLVIFTRGEYRHQLMQSIERMGPTRQFGVAKDE